MPAACTTAASGRSRSRDIATSIGAIANRSSVLTTAVACSSRRGEGRAVTPSGRAGAAVPSRGRARRRRRRCRRPRRQVGGAQAQDRAQRVEVDLAVGHQAVERVAQPGDVAAASSSSRSRRRAAASVAASVRSPAWSAAAVSTSACESRVPASRCCSPATTTTVPRYGERRSATPASRTQPCPSATSSLPALSIVAVHSPASSASSRRGVEPSFTSSYSSRATPSPSARA